MASSPPARGRYVLLVVMALALLLSSINVTIVAVALPSMTASLDASIVWVGWTLTAYQLVLIIAMPLAGRLSDTLGRKRVFLFCVGLFTVGSLLSGLAPNIGWLIVFRVLQAIGGGGLQPSAVGIVSDEFKERRAQLVGFFGSIMPIGTVIGPVFGGWIVENWTWREVFFVNVPIGALALVGAAVLLPTRPRGGALGRLDVPGLVLFGSAMLSILSAMTWVGHDPSAVGSLALWGLAGLGVLLFWQFLRQERRAANPIVELDLALRPPFVHAHLYNFLFGGFLFGLVSFVPYFAVTYYGMSAVQSGLVLTPRSLVVIGVSGVTSLLLPRIGYRLPMLAGAALAAAGVSLVSLGLRQVSIGPLAIDDFWVLALLVAVAGLGTGLSTPAAHNACLDLAPHKVAAISGLRSMYRNLGGVMAVSSIVLVMALSEDRAAGLRVSFLALGVLVLMGVPLALMVPEMPGLRAPGGIGAREQGVRLPAAGAPGGRGRGRDRA